ncbi:hypothetical protein KBTX_00742 [wastewater metagenome]|uniref:HTH tetR-type domain-containing protein n=2 Tax=unclassified sequences TaxID=12908 RepID=A0A5B8RA90_9ZZZZ|nr:MULTISPECIES: TetR/AcrR family transcriptional regulator [Arhodomonas]MCS4503556.1 TetR/AcrR family transcriptional regulator [Arhodomonas aquaeolei]QEA04434.1 hypothetical protein KBTEX_00742 [uncultured organism]
MGERDSTRERLLLAAARLVREQGVRHLTLAAVAREAGVSKGGLIYHFPSKEALLGAMVAHLLTVTEAGIDAHRETDTGAGSWTRGYLATCSPPERGEHPDNRMAAAVLAAGAGAPALLDPIRERQPAWRAALADDGIDAVDAMVVRLAADGLWMNDLFALPALDADERAAVMARLAAMTEAGT